MRPSFFHHLHPPTLPAGQSRLRYTLGAGGLAVFLVLALVVTGILLMFYYVPTPDQAALSIQTIAYLVPYGSFVRNLHYWAAQALVVVVVVHMLRVILTGAYTVPRRFNYFIGLCLLALVLMLDFSGYILRWDEGVHWALVAGTNLLKTVPVAGVGLYRIAVGGAQPGLATLIRFYAWHLFGLTLPLVGLSVWHLFRVRRDGGIAAPPPLERPDAERITRFDLARREGLVALIASILLIAVSLLFPAPIAPPITAQTTLTADAHAPWFLLWVQGLLRFGDPFLLGVATPSLMLLAFILIPYLFPADLGRWFPARGRPAQVLTGLVVVLWIVLTIVALRPAS